MLDSKLENICMLHSGFTVTFVGTTPLRDLYSSTKKCKKGVTLKEKWFQLGSSIDFARFTEVDVSLER